MNKEQIFEKLWKEYTDQNPSAKRVYDSFAAEGEVVNNDHIAFRTFNDPRVDIEVLSKPFKAAGYVEKGSYNFEAKKLFAKHYEHETDKNAPRVFISQLLTEEFSEFLQKTVKTIMNQIPVNEMSSNDLIFKGRLWEEPSYEVYTKLREESEYAAWLYVYGFRANHFTVSINSLKKYNTIQKVNQFLKEKGFMMNNSGGEIKGAPEQLLEQSSIKSEIIPLQFKEGFYDVPACYYEFALRYPDESGELYSGFIAKSADKIFESTDFYENKC